MQFPPSPPIIKSIRCVTMVDGYANRMTYVVHPNQVVALANRKTPHIAEVLCLIHTTTDDGEILGTAINGGYMIDIDQRSGCTIEPNDEMCITTTRVLEYTKGLHYNQALPIINERLAELYGKNS